MTKSGKRHTPKEENNVQAHIDQAIHGFSVTLDGKRVDPEVLNIEKSD